MERSRASGAMRTGVFVLSVWAAPAWGQCQSSVVGRQGGELDHVASIDSNRVVVSSARGLEILNVANAAAIVRTGRTEVDQNILKLRVRSGSAYALCETSRGERAIKRYDVTGAAPLYRDDLWLSQRADFDLSGFTAFIASHNAVPNSTTVTALDVQFPDTPLFVGSVALPGANTTTNPEVYFSMAGSLALATVYGGSPSGWRLWAVNAADASAMSVATVFNPGSLFPYTSMALSGAVLYGAHVNGVDVLNYSSRLGISRISTLPTPSATDLSTVGATLFAATQEGGVRPFDITTPASPAAYTPFNTAGSSNDLAINGDRCYVAEREGGLAVLQIGNPAAITQLGSFLGPAPSRVEDVQDSGGLIYVVDNFGLRILQPVNPDAPTVIGRLQLSDGAAQSCGARTVRVTGSNAYITGCDGMLRVVSVSNPAAPFLRAELPGLGADYDTAFFGSFAYCCSLSGLRIVNISNPSAPSLAGTYTLAGPVVNVETSGSLAFLGTRDFGVWIVSLANPTSPQLVGFFDRPGDGPCRGLALNGDSLFAARDGGLAVLGVSDPSSPTLRAFDPDLRPILGDPLKYRGDKLYMARSGAQSGLWMIDVAAPSAPTPLGGLLSPSLHGFTVLNGRMYYGDDHWSDLATAAVQTQWAPAFRGDPPDTMPCLGGEGLLRVNVSANPAPTYRWRKDGVDLPLGGRYIGADTATLRIQDLVPSDAGLYTCRATNSCAATESAPSRMSFCPVDFNCDEFVDFFDYNDFVSCFADQVCPPGRTADFNFDGFVDFFDYDDFVAAFGAGC